MFNSSFVHAGNLARSLWCLDSSGLNPGLMFVYGMHRSACAQQCVAGCSDYNSQVTFNKHTLFILVPYTSFLHLVLFAVVLQWLLIMTFNKAPRVLKRTGVSCYLLMSSHVCSY